MGAMELSVVRAHVSHLTGQRIAAQLNLTTQKYVNPASLQKSLKKNAPKLTAMLMMMKIALLHAALHPAMMLRFVHDHAHTSPNNHIYFLNHFYYHFNKIISVLINNVEA